MWYEGQGGTVIEMIDLINFVVFESHPYLLYTYNFTLKALQCHSIRIIRDYLHMFASYLH